MRVRVPMGRVKAARATVTMEMANEAAGDVEAAMVQMLVA